MTDTLVATPDPEPRPGAIVAPTTTSGTATTTMAGSYITLRGVDDTAAPPHLHVTAPVVVIATTTDADWTQAED